MHSFELKKCKIKYNQNSISREFFSRFETFHFLSLSHILQPWRHSSFFSPKLVAIPSPNTLLSHTLLSLSPLIDPSALPTNQTQTLPPHRPNPSNQFPTLLKPNPRFLNPRRNPDYHPTEPQALRPPSDKRRAWTREDIRYVKDAPSIEVV